MSRPSMFWISTIPGCANRRFVRLEAVRAARDEDAVRRSLQALTEAAGEADTTPGKRNLLHLAVQAARGARNGG